MGALNFCLYASSIYVIHGWLDFHPSTWLGNSKQAALCIQPKIRRACLFCLTIWLWIIRWFKSAPWLAVGQKWRRHTYMTFLLLNSFFLVMKFFQLEVAFQKFRRMSFLMNWNLLMPYFGRLYLPTYLHTYIHTYTHTYTHTLCTKRVGRLLSKVP